MYPGDNGYMTSTEHTHSTTTVRDAAGFHAECACGWMGANHPEAARETRQGESTRRFSYNPSREARRDAADHAKRSS